MTLFWYWFAQFLSWIAHHSDKIKHLYKFPGHLSTQELLKVAEVERCNQWGTFRGNLYFGMRTRSPHSLLTGLIWYSSSNDATQAVRHYCSLQDGVEEWGWEEHDGQSYGKQTIIDAQTNLKMTIYVRIYDGDNWSAQFKLMPLNESEPFNVHLIHYIADEHHYSGMQLVDSSILEKDLNGAAIEGFNERNGQYRLSVTSEETSAQSFALRAPAECIWDASSLLTDFINRKPRQEASRDHSFEPNFVAVQYEVNKAEAVKVQYQRGKPKKLASTKSDPRKLFRRQVDAVFQSIPRRSMKACRFALSNLLGSISYFYGTSFVTKQNEVEKSVVETAPFELFTDIPSRATFPRGFLWDSGFHNLIISEWNPELSLQILQSWANRIEHNGWVAREQVPGQEARRAVPVEYIVQNTKHANPPALLMTLHKLAKAAKIAKSADLKQIIQHQLRHIVPQFEKNMKWLARSQRGQIHPHYCHLMKGITPCHKVLKLPAYRWRGRSKYHNLNSGLDDYPRGDIANKFELHVDLACWVAFGIKSLLEIYQLLDVKGCEGQKLKFIRLYRKVRTAIDHLHWDEQRQIYSDTTISNDGDLMFTQHRGYVNLFPLLFGFIDLESPRLKGTLDLIEDREALWTDYGLRSLALDDPYYMKGDQYWTGPIWININYLVLRALNTYYMEPDGPYYDQVMRIYAKLRSNIIENMTESFEKTGTIWEQYSDMTGEGQRSRPFTGWSALLILIASEKY